MDEEIRERPGFGVQFPRRLGAVLCAPHCLQTADRQYMEGFNDELEAFKERVRGRAKLRIEKAMKEYEEEERRKRLGPGGLDPVEVYESLPEVLASPAVGGGKPAQGE